MNRINISVKLVIFSIINDKLAVFSTHNILPSEKIDSEFSLDETVGNIFEKETKIPIKDSYTEQLYTVSEEKSINIVYYVLAEQAKILYNQEYFKPYDEMDKTIPDYPVISYAVQRLQWKIEYTNVVYSLLAQEFTLGNLQRIYEAILNKSLDKRNFRKKILSLNFLTPTNKKRIGSARQ